MGLACYVFTVGLLTSLVINVSDAKIQRQLYQTVRFKGCVLISSRVRGVRTTNASSQPNSHHRPESSLRSELQRSRWVLTTEQS
jgi:hypothetical protein